jgi:hypothetical protein
MPQYYLQILGQPGYLCRGKRELDISLLECFMGLFGRVRRVDIPRKLYYCHRDSDDDKKLYNIDTRKDITQQDLKDPVTVELVEKCARFHIVCAERLIEEVRYRFENLYLK